MMSRVPDLRLEVLPKEEVLVHSFGRVNIVARTAETPGGAKGTLHDPAIFGPAEDYRCACGRMEGRGFTGRVCAYCGVRVGRSRLLRRRRWGHIQLPAPVGHPLRPGRTVEAIPVLPPVLPPAVNLRPGPGPPVRGRGGRGSGARSDYLARRRLGTSGRAAVRQRMAGGDHHRRGVALAVAALSPDRRRGVAAT